MINLILKFSCHFLIDASAQWIDNKCLSNQNQYTIQGVKQISVIGGKGSPILLPMECYVTARPLLREHTNFYFFLQPCYWLSSPHSLLLQGIGLFFYFSHFMHIGMPEGRQWVHELGELFNEYVVVWALSFD